MPNPLTIAPWSTVIPASQQPLGSCFLSSIIEEVSCDNCEALTLREACELSGNVHTMPMSVQDGASGHTFLPSERSTFTYECCAISSPGKITVNDRAQCDVASGKIELQGLVKETDGRRERVVEKKTYSKWVNGGKKGGQGELEEEMFKNGVLVTSGEQGAGDWWLV
ncbi:unnamed protein product [Pleuronectes platessa]|uniref:Uncharacterized protein n=1 Tax=Pleuronectes platessa TaxID=8262 RepID=A0A9N7UEA8_PLEPL|nr:unnamed protein product [Pleuronectes platessa]